MSKNPQLVIRCRAVVAAPFFLVALAQQPVLAENAAEPGNTPYRPTVSNPAELSAPGWLEVEAGVARTKGGDTAWRNNAPWLAKLAFTENFGLLLGGDARVRQIDADGAVVHGQGDTSLALKHRWEVDDKSAFGLEWGSKIATARAGIGSGKNDYGFTGIYSRDIAEYRVDANIGATRLGLREEDLARWQYPWAVAVSRSAGEDWTLAFEISGTYRRGAAAATQVLFAASYSVTKRLTFDIGASSRMSEAAPKWSAFAGFTYLAARFW